MAAVTAGKIVASSAATASSALLTNVLIASSAPVFARHLPFSKTPSSVLKTNRVDSGGNSFKIAFVAAAAAWRTTSPLSMWRSKSVEREGIRTGARLRSEEHTSELQSPDHLVCRL